MKRIYTLFCSLLLVICSSTFAQQTSSYYVIIGAFNIEANAQQFTDHVQSLGLPAVYGLNPEGNIYYVYSRTTADQNEANKTAESLKEEGLKGVWVFKGSLTSKYIFAKSDVKQVPVSEQVLVSEVVTLEKPADQPVENISVSVPNEQPKVVETVSEPSSTPTEPTVAEVKPATKRFVFKLTNGTTGSPVSGNVHLLETDRALQYREYKSNEMVEVIAPANRNGRWYLVCQVVGFKPFKKNFIYQNPVKSGGGASVGAEQEVIIPIELVRVKKGDYIELDRVKFFKNSDILTPESEQELTELYNMMQENPGYKIRLHGHTNGKESVEIIKLGESDNFFELNDTNKRENGSAKELSTLRAETVKKYLMSKGIEESRIAARGEGGTQPIFDPKGTMAENNSRVEVEITKQ
jgi:flagellar motor protein MotB